MRELSLEGLRGEGVIGGFDVSVDVGSEVTWLSSRLSVGTFWSDGVVADALGVVCADSESETLSCASTSVSALAGKLPGGKASALVWCVLNQVKNGRFHILCGRRGRTKMIANTKVATPATQPIVCVESSEVHCGRCQVDRHDSTTVTL